MILWHRDFSVHAEGELIGNDQRAGNKGLVCAGLPGEIAVQGRHGRRSGRTRIAVMRHCRLAIIGSVAGNRMASFAPCGGCGWGIQLVPRLAPGATVLSVPGRCFTKQTGDMVYSMAENSWLSRLRLGA